MYAACTQILGAARPNENKFYAQQELMYTQKIYVHCCVAIKAVLHIVWGLAETLN